LLARIYVYYTCERSGARESPFFNPLNSFKLLTNCPPDRELCAISSPRLSCVQRIIISVYTVGDTTCVSHIFHFFSYPHPPAPHYTHINGAHVYSLSNARAQDNNIRIGYIITVPSTRRSRCGPCSGNEKVVYYEIGFFFLNIFFLIFSFQPAASRKIIGLRKK
jgi:hypothetical protein